MQPPHCFTVESEDVGGAFELPALACIPAQLLPIVKLQLPSTKRSPFISPAVPVSGSLTSMWGGQGLVQLCVMQQFMHKMLTSLHFSHLRRHLAGFFFSFALGQV